MPGTTTRHSFPYPVGSDLAGTGDGTLSSLAGMLDDKLSIARHGSSMTVANNIVSYTEDSPNMSGYIIIQTNVTFGNYMTSLNIRGYQYQNIGNIVDLTISFYAYAADTSIHHATVCNRGSAQFTEALILRRDSDGKVAIALKPHTPSGLWHYPKLWVDGMFGHTDITIASLKTGWSIARAANLTGYTTKTNLHVFWTTIEQANMLNGWVHHDTLRTPQYLRTFDGWVRFRGLIKNGTVGSPAFSMPDGFRPQATAVNEVHFASAAGSAAGTFGVSNSEGHVKPLTGSNVWVDLSSICYKIAPV